MGNAAASDPRDDTMEYYERIIDILNEALQVVQRARYQVEGEPSPAQLKALVKQHVNEAKAIYLNAKEVKAESGEPDAPHLSPGESKGYFGDDENSGASSENIIDDGLVGAKQPNGYLKFLMTWKQGYLNTISKSSHIYTDATAIFDKFINRYIDMYPYDDANVRKTQEDTMTEELKRRLAKLHQLPYLLFDGLLPSDKEDGDEDLSYKDVHAGDTEVRFLDYAALLQMLTLNHSLMTAKLYP